jgi:macrolide-specific efflux system membrane fusion protein
VTAQIQAKQALLQQYRQEYQRQQQLMKADATSKAEFESAQAQFEAAQSELVALQAQLKKAVIAVDSAQTNLGYTRISAPMDGVVISIDSDEGQTLVSAQTASTLLTLADVGKMTIKAEISEADVTKVKAGQQVYFTILGEPDNRYNATLRAIEPGPTEAVTSSLASSSTAVYYNGLFDVDNRAGRLRVGMTTEVTIILKQATQVLAAPVAVLRESGSKGVTQVDVLENGRPVPRNVRLGLNDKVHVQFIEGVCEGERLLLHSLTTSEETDSNTHPGPFGGGPPLGGRP